MNTLLPDFLTLLLANKEDGDVSTYNYPFVKNCLQAALGWDLERADSVHFEPEHVVTGPARPTPLGDDIEALLGAFAKPQPLTHQWFFLKLDPSGMMVTEFFDRRLVEQGWMEDKQVSRLLIFKKTVHPRTAAGEAKYQELATSVIAAMQALLTDVPQLAQFSNEVWVGAWLLDAFQLRRLVDPKSPKEGNIITKGALRALIDGGLLSKNYVKAAYTYAKNVTGFGSAMIFTDNFFDEGRY